MADFSVPETRRSVLLILGPRHFVGIHGSTASRIRVGYGYCRGLESPRVSCDIPENFLTITPGMQKHPVLKAHYISLPGRPVHSSAISTFLGIIQPRCTYYSFK